MKSIYSFLLILFIGLAASSVSAQDGSNDKVYMMNGEEKNLIIFDYPKLPLEKFSKIEVNYTFSSKINLGGNFEGYFTKKPA